MAGERAEYFISQTLDERLERLAKRRDQIAGLVARGVLDPIHLEREDELVASLKAPSPLVAVSPTVIETVPVEGIAEIWVFLSNLVSETEVGLSDCPAFDFYRSLVEKIPYYVHSEKQQQAVQALSSIDPDTVRMGRGVLILLNLKTVLNAVEPFLSENDEENDEMIQGVIASALGLEDLNPNVTVPQQIHQAATREAASSIAGREKVPIKWVLDGKHRTAVSLVNEIFRQHPYGFNKAEIDAFSAAIGSQTGLSVGSVKVYLRYRNFLISDQKTAGGIEEAEDQLMQESLASVIQEVLGTLTDKRARDVINSRFGVEDGMEKTLEEIGTGFGVTRERIRQIEAKALKRLRHPVRSNRLREYDY